MSKHIKMLVTASGSENGIHISMFEAGQEYEISDRLASVFVDQMKIASYIEFDDDDDDLDMKMINTSPENKSVNTPENKDLSSKRKIVFRR